MRGLCGAGRSIFDECLMEGWYDDGGDDEEGAAARRRNEETIMEITEEERIGGSSAGEYDGDEDEGEEELTEEDMMRFRMMTEEDLMRGLEEGWEELVGEGGMWERLQGRKAALCSFELSAVAFLEQAGA